METPRAPERGTGHGARCRPSNAPAPVRIGAAAVPADDLHDHDLDADHRIHTTDPTTPDQNTPTHPTDNDPGHPSSTAPHPDTSIEQTVALARAGARW